MKRLQVHLADGIHVIEFEHGTTSGSRLLRVDREVRMGKEAKTFFVPGDSQERLDV